jgi:hypothetical protein
MIRQEVIVQKLSIERIRQAVAFQVRLPKDTNRIIGLEYHTRKIYSEPEFPFFQQDDPPVIEDSFLLKANKVIGQLSLRTLNCAGLFYQGDLFDYRNTGYLEKIAAERYTVQPWIQCTKREEINFCVSGTLIEGLFKDSFGTDEYDYLEYELTLYFWIEKCTDDN